MGFSTVLMLGSTAFKAYSAAQQAEAQRERLGFQANISERNRVTQLQDAARIAERGKEREARYRDRIQQTVGSVRAHGAASGFVVDSGVSERLQGDVRFAGEMDILQLQQATEDRVRATVRGAENTGFEADMLRAERESVDPLAIGGSTLLSGGARAAANYARLNE